MTPQRLALFDLDYTLLPLDTDYQWADFLLRTGRAGDPVQARRRNDELMALYNRGELTAELSAQFLLGLLAMHTPSNLAVWHEEFMATVIRPVFTEQAVRLVEAHLAAGDLCALATSTNSFVTAPIARAFGLPYLLATEPEYVNGRYTGRIHGIPCFKEGKVTRVQTWLAAMGLTLADFEESFFYSDSVNDVHLLQAVTRPIATNPSPALRAISQENGWPVLDLFEPIKDTKS